MREEKCKLIIVGDRSKLWAIIGMIDGEPGIDNAQIGPYVPQIPHTIDAKALPVSKRIYRRAHKRVGASRTDNLIVGYLQKLPKGAVVTYKQLADQLEANGLSRTSVSPALTTLERAGKVERLGSQQCRLKGDGT